MNNHKTIILGKQLEELAANYLINKKLQLLKKNFYSPFGEIDLIFNDPIAKQLVFVEVRYRKSILFGEAAATITKLKQNKLIKSANYYLMKFFYNKDLCYYQQINYRFDVIACSGPLDRIKIEWFCNVFC